MKKGDIARYGGGPTALFRLEEQHGSRWYGQHVLGGGHSAEEFGLHRMVLASEDDIALCKERRPEWFASPNHASVPKLLRAMGASAMGTEGRRMIFDTAADMIDENAAIIKLLEDVPGDNALDKVRRLKAWYLEFQNEQAEIGRG